MVQVPLPSLWKEALLVWAPLVGAEALLMRTADWCGHCWWRHRYARGKTNIMGKPHGIA